MAGSRSTSIVRVFIEEQTESVCLTVPLSPYAFTGTFSTPSSSSSLPPGSQKSSTKKLSCASCGVHHINLLTIAPHHFLSWILKFSHLSLHWLSWWCLTIRPCGSFFWSGQNCPCHFHEKLSKVHQVTAGPRLSGDAKIVIDSEAREGQTVIGLWSLSLFLLPALTYKYIQWVRDFRQIFFRSPLLVVPVVCK